jgi:hypothetical protein
LFPPKFWRKKPKTSQLHNARRSRVPTSTYIIDWNCTQSGRGAYRSQLSWNFQ